MKKLAYFLVAAICMMVAGCADDAGAFRNFRLLDPSFTNADGEKVVFNYSVSKLHYEDGDPIYVNGTLFTLENQGSQWVANSSTGAEVANVNNLFYVAYADNGSLSSFNPSTGSYAFNLSTKVNVQPTNPTVITDAHSTSTNGIIIAGASSENVVHLYPACAIIRLATNTAYTYVKVGFDGGKVPYQGTLLPTTSGASISSSGASYLEGVTTDLNGSFLYMIKCDNGWYVAVPIVGNSVSTTLYFEWNDGSSTTKFKTQGQVTLQKGYVYNVGSANQTPFTVNGASTRPFSVGASTSVKFSAGNLQYQAYDLSTSTYDHWRFAPHQYDIIGDNNQYIADTYQNWIDLFGWGTSGYDSGAETFMPYSSEEDETYYYPGGSGVNNLTGSTYKYADWGVYNSNNIAYGNKTTTGNWRTLTATEWNYLINVRAGHDTLYGFAIIAGTHRGMIILPNYDYWTRPSDVSFVPGITGSGYGANSYTYSDWDKMEMAGAIFLPAAGKRMGAGGGSVTQLGVNAQGYYWSTTGDGEADGFDAKGINFSNTSATFVNYYIPRSQGCSVRLVKAWRDD